MDGVGQVDEATANPRDGAVGDAWRPLFIVGTGRSGTTLLAALLDRHSAIAVPPETNFVGWMRRRRACHGGRVPRVADAAAVAADERLGDLGADVDAVAAAIRDGRAPSYPSLWRWLLTDYAARRGKRLVGEKTPLHLLEVPLLLQWFPLAEVACLVRDGRDVCVSRRRMPWTHADLQMHALRWRADARLVRRWQRRYPGRVTVVRYEDLCREPAVTLQRIVGRFGLRVESAQLAAQADSPVVPARERAWKQDVAGAITTARIGAWREATTPHERWVLASAMARELARWGYEEATAEAAPWLERARLRLGESRIGLQVLRARLATRPRHWGGDPERI